MAKLSGNSCGAFAPKEEVESITLKWDCRPTIETRFPGKTAFKESCLNGKAFENKHLQVIQSTFPKLKKLKLEGGNYSFSSSALIKLDELETFSVDFLDSDSLIYATPTSSD